MPPCTAAGSGRCASTPASAPPRRPTGATSYLLAAGRPGSRWPSIFPPRWATTPTTRWRGRGRAGRRGDRLAGRHADAARRDPARRGLHLDDDQRHRGDAARALRGGRRRAGRRPRDARGTVQNDILKEYIARGTYIYPPAASLRLITDMFAFCASEVPRWNTISISGYHIREAGATRSRRWPSPGRRHRLRRGRGRRRAGRRRLRPAAVVLLQRAQRPLRGGRQVPRGAAAVGAADARALRRAATRGGSCASTPRPRARPSPRSSR